MVLQDKTAQGRIYSIMEVKRTGWPSTTVYYSDDRKLVELTCILLLNGNQSIQPCCGLS